MPWMNSRRRTRQSWDAAAIRWKRRQRFQEKLNLNFPLLADTEFQVVEAYGARRMKSFLGKTFLGIVRTTFWIGPDGIIRKIWNNVTPKGPRARKCWRR